MELLNGLCEMKVKHKIVFINCGSTSIPQFYKSQFLYNLTEADRLYSNITQDNGFLTNIRFIHGFIKDNNSIANAIHRPSVGRLWKLDVKYTGIKQLRSFLCNTRIFPE